MIAHRNEPGAVAVRLQDDQIRLAEHPGPQPVTAVAESLGGWILQRLRRQCEVEAYDPVIRFRGHPVGLPVGAVEFALQITVPWRIPTSRLQAEHESPGEFRVRRVIHPGAGNLNPASGHERPRENRRSG